MDFQAILSILLVILYFAFQIAGRKKREQQRPVPQRAPVPQRTAGADAGMSEWERALREIRTALGDSEPEPPPKRQAPAPTSLPQQNQRLSPAPRTTPKAKPAPIPRAERSLENTHFEEWNPEKAFERRAPVKKPAQKAAVPRPALTPEQPTSQRQAPHPEGRRAILDLLNEPKTAQNAIILGEILGPPRSRNPL